MPTVSPEEEARREEERQRDAEDAERRTRSGRWDEIIRGEVNEFKHVKLSDFIATTDRQKTVLAAMREYLDSIRDRVAAGEGLLLFGPCGTGKDHLAMSVLRAAILRDGLRGARINGPEWYGSLRDMMGDDSSSEYEEIRRLSYPDVLLISDPLPPMGSLSQHQSTMLYRVMEKRQACGRPTIVTVNTTGEADACDRMGTATVERMKYKAWVVECNWPSYRQPARVV